MSSPHTPSQQAATQAAAVAQQLNIALFLRSLDSIEQQSDAFYDKLYAREIMAMLLEFSPDFFLVFRLHALNNPYSVDDASSKIRNQRIFNSLIIEFIPGDISDLRGQLEQLQAQMTSSLVMNLSEQQPESMSQLNERYQQSSNRLHQQKEQISSAANAVKKRLSVVKNG
jgi:hypothetical protein